MTIGIMEVTLLGARGLKNTDFLNKIDPYVVIQYRNQRRTSSIARGEGRRPDWNEKFKFNVGHPTAGLVQHHDHDTLSLTIMDHDTFTHDDYLGKTTIYLKELLELGVEKGKAELGIQQYRVVANDKTYQGEICVGITFTLEVETDEQEYGEWRESHR